MIKKILALLLALTCVFTAFSCGKDGPGDKKAPTLNDTSGVIADAFGSFSDNPNYKPGSINIRNLSKLFTSLAPKKSVAIYTETFGNSDIVITTKVTLIVGKIDGVDAAVRETVTTKLRSIESGSGKEELEPFEELTELLEYREDKGVRTNGGKWMDDEESFVVGIMVLNVNSDLVSGFVSDNVAKTVKFNVAKDNSKDVFGYEMDCDSSVEIAHDGSLVTGISIDYTAPKDNKDHFDIPTSIDITYSYEDQRIDIK